MPNDRIVFIVGAGASTDFAFPIGRELRDSIRDLLDRERLNDEIRAAIEFTSSREVLEYVNAAHAVSRSIYAHPSIDRALAFGDVESANASRMKIVGKLAIAKIILDREVATGMTDSLFTLERFHSTWLGELIVHLLHLKTAETISSVFDRISFICFNYDRCIEQYFYLALQEVLRCEPRQAADLVRKLRIFHPYGTVGRISWLRPYDPGRPFLDFGTKGRANVLLNAAAGITTIGDRSPDNPSSDWLGEVANAGTVVFLGFGFHDENVDLLRTATRSARRSFATTYKLARARRTDIEDVLSQFMVEESDWRSSPSCTDLNCAEFVREYGDEILLR
jgi:hypothetical protein